MIDISEIRKTHNALKKLDQYSRPLAQKHITVFQDAQIEVIIQNYVLIQLQQVLHLYQIAQKNNQNSFFSQP